MGRDLQDDAGQEPQVCLTLPILRGLDGERRMGKSLGNYIGVGEPAKEQFAKTMSIPDELMPEWFTLLTDRAEGGNRRDLVEQPDGGEEDAGPRHRRPSTTGRTRRPRRRRNGKNSSRSSKIRRRSPKYK